MGSISDSTMGAAPPQAPTPSPATRKAQLPNSIQDPNAAPALGPDPAPGLEAEPAPAPPPPAKAANANMHEVSFASLMHFSVGDRKVQGAGGGLEAFENRILLARRGWGRALPFPLFVVVADQSVKTREVLQLNNCKLENGTLWASAPLAFEEWVCDAPNYEAFRVVLTTCSGRYSEWAANGCCAYDRSVQYAMDIRKEDFAAVNWFGISDDDVGFATEGLFPFLAQLDSSQRIALNPSAHNLKDQEVGMPGMPWNPIARLCNNVIPEKFVGTVTSRGLLEATAALHGQGGLEKICGRWDKPVDQNGSQDTVLGLFWWAFDAYFVPMADKFVDNPNIGYYPKATKSTALFTHAVRTALQHNALALQSPIPFAKLPGAQFSDSILVAEGKTVADMGPVNCQPHRKGGKGLTVDRELAELRLSVCRECFNPYCRCQRNPDCKDYQPPAIANFCGEQRHLNLWSGCDLCYDPSLALGKDALESMMGCVMGKIKQGDAKFKHCLTIQAILKPK